MQRIATAWQATDKPGLATTNFAHRTLRSEATCGLGIRQLVQGLPRHTKTLLALIVHLSEQGESMEAGSISMAFAYLLSAMAPDEIFDDSGLHFGNLRDHGIIDYLDDSADGYPTSAISLCHTVEELLGCLDRPTMKLLAGMPKH